MLSLFRYLPEQFEETFVKRGEVFFRSLSYYRDLEKDGVRGDQFEGTKVHRPNDGLRITKVETGEVIHFPKHTFQSTANEDYIYVSCMSMEFSPQIASRFGTKVCVEILDSGKFISRLQKAITKVLGSNIAKQMVHGEVKYYTHNDPPMGDWALPEKIALSKLKDFEWQKEFRIAYPTNNAFDVENVRVQIAPLGDRATSLQSAYPKRIYPLGDLSSICKVHRM